MSCINLVCFPDGSTALLDFVDCCGLLAREPEAICEAFWRYEPVKLADGKTYSLVAEDVVAGD